MYLATIDLERVCDLLQSLGTGLEVTPAAEPWLRVLAALLSIFTLSLVLSLMNRIVHVDRPMDLFRSRFREVPPLRVLFHLGYWSMITVSLFTGILAIRLAYLLNEAKWKNAPYDISLLLAVPALSSLTIYWLARRLHRGLIQLPTFESARVAITEAETLSGFDSSELADLGAERFPNPLRTRQSGELAFRRILVAGCLAVAGWSGYGIWARAEAKQVDHLAFALQPVLAWGPGFGAAEIGLLLVLGSSSFVMLMFANRDYTLLRGRTVIVAALISISATVLAITGLSDLRSRVDLVEYSLIGCSFLCTWRLLADLGRARRYFAHNEVEQSIRRDLEIGSTSLNAVLVHPETALPLVQPKEVAARIAQGCLNIEERGSFVTRNFGQLIRIARIQSAPIAMGVLRLMTVRRALRRVGGWPTHRALFRPEVPIWDLRRFPIRPPEGFANWIDPLPLDASYNVVLTCGGCGGTGTVQKTVTEYRTEYRSQYQNGQNVQVQVQVAYDRYVTETCGSCSGSGRLEYSQVIDTIWLRIEPATTSPALPMPEFLEGAEERVHYRRPLMDHFNELKAVAATAVRDESLLARMDTDFIAARKALPKAVAAVGSLHGARVYRADFQIASLHILRINFGRLLTSVGWFFGRRPEFYFPRLPLSWSTIACYWTVPPLALALAITTILAAQRIFDLISISAIIL